MMGHSHAASGLAVGAATLPAAPVTGWAAQTAWVACWGGMAMLPDLDHPNATIAHLWGPLSRVPARAVAAAAGGHRNGTHSAAGVTALTALAVLADWTHAGRLILLALAIGLALRACAFAIPGQLEATIAGNLALSWAGAWWLLGHGHGLTWLPLAVAGGSVVHICGDLLTVGGVPLAWPVSKARQELHLFKTGATVEVALLAPALILLAGWLCWRNMPAAHHALHPFAAALKAASR